MNEGAKHCICRQLLQFEIVDAVEHAPRRDEIYAAIRACMTMAPCGVRDALTPEPESETTPDGEPSRRKRSDRRTGQDRRQNAQPWPADKERRSGQERRSGGDRRGLLAGERYTPQQAFLNLKAWCNGHCQAPFELKLDKETGGLHFRFEDPQDRADFTEMLKLFKGMSAPGS